MAAPSPLAAAYKNFRSSKYFVLSLVIFIASWMTLHFARQFDADWGGLNLALSIEASVGMSIFMMVSERQEQAQRRQLEYLLHLMEAQHALLRLIAKEDGQ